VPYPGRAALAGRMVMAATLALLITMTFRIPFGAYCAVYAFTISRESPQITVKIAVTRTLSFALGTIYVLVGAFFLLTIQCCVCSGCSRR
jgi:multidrug resistance protein MdtO